MTEVRLEIKSACVVENRTRSSAAIFASQIRHPSFLVSDFRTVAQFNVAFVFADTAGKCKYAEDLTADFVYCRLHGDTKALHQRLQRRRADCGQRD